MSASAVVVDSDPVGGRNPGTTESRLETRMNMKRVPMSGRNRSGTCFVASRIWFNKPSTSISSRFWRCAMSGRQVSRIVTNQEKPTINAITLHVKTRVAFSVAMPRWA